jgi:hypothetical protein
MDWMDGKSLEGGETKNNGEYYSSKWELVVSSSSQSLSVSNTTHRTPPKKTFRELTGFFFFSFLRLPVPHP